LKKGVVRKAIQQAPFKLPVSMQKGQQPKSAAKVPAKAAPAKAAPAKAAPAKPSK
jgi:hypothetical protein